MKTSRAGPSGLVLFYFLLFLMLFLNNHIITFAHTHTYINIYNPKIYNTMKHHTLPTTYYLLLTTYYFLLSTSHFPLPPSFLLPSLQFATCQNCPTHYQMLSIMTIAHLHMKLKSATMTTNPQNAKIKKLKSVPHSPVLGNACLQFVSDSSDPKNPCYYKKSPPLNV